MSKIGKGEWIIVAAVAIIIDVTQWCADFILGAGEGGNEIADPIIGAAFAAYFKMRGVSLMKHPSRFAALVGGVFAEMISVSVLPAWIFDVWYFHHDIKKEDAAIKAAQEQQEWEQGTVAQPLYQNGRRNPQSPSESAEQPMYRDGMRRRGNIRPLETKSYNQTNPSKETSFSA